MSSFKYLSYFNQILMVQLMVCRRVLHWSVADPLMRFIAIQRDLVQLRILRQDFTPQTQLKLFLAKFVTDSQKYFLLQMEKQVETRQKCYSQAMHCLMRPQTESQFAMVSLLQTSLRPRIHRVEVVIQILLNQCLNYQIVTLFDWMVVYYQKMMTL